jgi:hypothetical protein
MEITNQYPPYVGLYADFNGGTKEQLDKEIERLHQLIDGCTDLEDYPDEVIADINALEDLKPKNNQ